MFTVEELEKREHEQLKPYACFSDLTERNHIDGKHIGKHPLRTEFQRDRDRIIHSKAFRRLEYKTQVFLTQTNDHHRTRLTHSLEVAQLSKTVSMQLGLNCDLTEAIALGHDVGHTPFGHAGEKALIDNLSSKSIFTFKHNTQSIRVLDLLEKKYDYNGLCLTLPVREGILKHTKLPKDIPVFCEDLFVDKPFSITLEGQVVAIVDEIAQITHDMDDYLRYDFIQFEEFRAHPIFKNVSEFYKKEKEYNVYKRLNSIMDEQRKKDTIIRCLVDYLISTLINNSEKNLKDKDIKALEIDQVFIDFNDDDNVKQTIIDFHKYTTDLMFNDYRVINMDNRGKTIIYTLFAFYQNYPDQLPVETLDKYDNAKGNDKLIVIVDHISGMTDRYAIEQCKKIINELI